MTSERTFVDAGPSNAGDRYHFAYAARRMLDTLHPRDGATLLVMEGVSWRDSEKVKDPEDLLGVDLTEYFGSEQAKTASRIEIVQVKYSALHPTESWTVRRLTSDRSRPRTSVLAKLARAFAFALAETGESRAATITIRLQTNQPLAPSLQTSWSSLRDAMLTSTIEDAQALIATRVKKDDELALLHKAAALSDREFVHFIRQFVLDGFGSAMLTENEASLFKTLELYTSDDPNVQNLIAYVQEHAIPGRKSELRREDVLALLRLGRNSFFPAMPELEPGDDLFSTVASRELIAQIRDSPGGVTLVHGLAGVGKTSTLQLVARDVSTEAVIYDCWAGGKGVASGEERFLVTSFLVQLTNEIDALLHTNILSSTRISRRDLSDRFRDAITAAVMAAEAIGRRFVIAIDAADDAAQAAAESDLAGAESFIPWLWKFRWPERCVVLVSTRTENLPRLRAPDHVPRFEIEGFALNETGLLASAMRPEMDAQLVDLIHERTGGNPRVVHAIVESLPATTLNDQLAFVTEHARKKAFDYYRDAAPDRLTAAKDLVLLAVLNQMTPFPTVDVVSSVVNRDPDEIRALLANLSFGVVVGAGGLVRWRNKDFHAFVASFVIEEMDEAAKLLANFCRAAFETNTYARVNFSRHLYAAGRYEELLDFWMAGDRLAQRVVDGTAGEDVLTDVQYALLASAQLHRHVSTIQLLSFASELAHGRSLFVAALRHDAEPVVEEGFTSRLVAMLADEQPSAELGRNYLALAIALARREPHSADVREYLARARDLLNTSETPTLNDLLLIATVIAAQDGVRAAIDSVKREERFQPDVIPSLMRRVALSSVADFLQDAIDDSTRLHALLGLIDRDDLSAGDVDAYVADAARLLERGAPVDSGAIGDAVERLLRRGFENHARTLLPHWTPPVMKDRGWPWSTGFLRNRAVREALLGEVLDVGAFYAFRMGGAHGAGVSDPYAVARRDAEGLYPGYRLRALAWARHGGVHEMLVRFLDEWTMRDRVPFLINTTAANLLQAIQALPRRDVSLARRVFKLVRSTLEPSARDYELAAFLASDGNWGREAENWLRVALEDLAPPQVRATDASAILIRLYASARLVNRQLARDLFARARLVASEADAGLYERVVTMMHAVHAAASARSATTLDLLDAAEVLEHAEQVESQLPKEYPSELLSVLAQADLGAAFALATAWDRRRVMRVSDAVFGIALGLAVDDRDPAAEWPLFRFAPNAPGAIALIRNVIRAGHAHGDAPTVENALAAYADILAKQVEISNHVLAAEYLVKFAQERGLVNFPIVKNVAAFVERGRAAGIEKPQEFSATRIDALIAEAEQAPLVALERLISATDEELEKLGDDALANVCEVLAAALPSERVRELLPVVHRAAAGARAIISLAALRSSEAAEAIRALVSTATARDLASWSSPRSDVRAALAQAFDTEEYLGLMIFALAEKLRELSADDIQRWIGHLIPYVGDAARPSLRFVLDRSLRKLPDVASSIAPTERTGRAVIIHEIANLLGHPEVRVRWLAVYALVDFAASFGDELYGFLASELADVSHERWMTKREWLMLVLEHLSLREPERLVPLAPVIVAQALDGQFPHALIRERARAIALRIEARVPGTLTESDRLAVERINRVRKHLPADAVREEVDGPDPYEPGALLRDSLAFAREPLSRVDRSALAGRCSFHPFRTRSLG